MKNRNKKRARIKAFCAKKNYKLKKRIKRTSFYTKEATQIHHSVERLPLVVQSLVSQRLVRYFNESTSLLLLRSHNI